MNVLVTGGLGFIGFNLVRELARIDSVTVISADIHEPSADQQAALLSAGQSVRLAHLDVRDREAFLELVTAERITHIVHAAAITPSEIQESTQAPFVIDVNLAGSLNALAVGYEQVEVERVLLVSSSGVYGLPRVGNTAPQPEIGPLELNNLYSITKYSAELVAERYATLSRKMMAAVRLGSVYGPFEQPGESRTNVSHVQRMTDALVAGRMLRLYGPDVSRDWVYTVDVADAIYALLTAPRWNYPTYNIGTGVAVSFREIADSFKQLGLQMEWVENPAEADIAMLDSSWRAALRIERLQAETGFTPKYSFADGLFDYLSRPGRED